MKKWIAALALMTLSAKAHVHFEQAHIRVLPPGVPNTAAYFTLHNDTDAPLVLVSAESDIAQRIEIHSHVMHDGMMRMEKQDSLTIPAQGSQAFQPGGYHLMVFGVREPLTPGQSVTITVYTDKGTPFAFQATAVRPGQSVSQEHHGHHEE
ncbi:copper chaperone PCu(A)C [Aestuariibacter halophilus]|uniref:Copper chaperone PCu(A)C n=1 Tax=Fluctibacter halophilus TaxID=226011 RepID=A0ABS8GCK1_9ALTE|nr:copper chaperone PCu(A)C [Aestuariibacter halophilus]MCC2618238.1 copper chaperone PCu(A)C [Aestuariibacter halophilus]